MSWPNLGKALAAYPRKNILTSMLWLSGITFPISVVAFCLVSSPKDYLVLALGFIPVLTSIHYYRHWSTEDPNRLQTEDYRLKLEAYARMHPEIGDSQVVIEGDSTAKLISNPSARSEADV